MAGVSVMSFDTWLSEKLLCINKDVDLDVFVQYIRGILDTDTSIEDKNESLEGIIGEILVCYLLCVETLHRLHFQHRLHRPQM